MRSRSPEARSEQLLLPERVESKRSGEKLNDEEKCEEHLQEELPAAAESRKG